MTSRADDDETTAFVTMYLQGSLSPVRRTLVFQGELVPLDRGKELAVSLVELLSDLSRRGIRLRAEGGQLSIEAPKGALTPDLRGTLEAHKPELLVPITLFEQWLGELEDDEALLEARVVLHPPVEHDGTGAVRHGVEDAPRAGDLGLGLDPETDHPHAAQQPKPLDIA